MDCSNNFHDYLVHCTDTIKVNALLTPATNYKWVITDKFGKQYSGESLTDGSGFFEIPVEDLPPGLLTSYSGEFKLEIYSDELYGIQCHKIHFQMSKFYEAICFELRAGTNEKNNLGCEFDCISSGASGGNSAVFPFTDESTVNIPWTNLLSGLYGLTPLVQVYHEVSAGVFQLVDVEITLSGSPLTDIDVDNGGQATGYILVSS